MGMMQSSPFDRPTSGIEPSVYRLPAETRIGRVRLAVSDLSKSLEFYTGVIGLTVYGTDHHDQTVARLGVHGDDTVLLELQPLPNAPSLGHQPRLGLYHAAFLLPSREHLSSFIQHLNTDGVPFGASDHLYSEALYLTDPDGFTVEVYADRPREKWRFEDGELLTGVFPLQIAELPQVAPGSWKGVPPGTTVGHVHFFVGDLPTASAFYHRGMGLQVMTWRHPGALFTSAGGYHHHVALNTWAANSPTATADEPRLLFWELILPNVSHLSELLLNLSQQSFKIAEPGCETTVADPWGIHVHLLSAS